MLKLFVFSALLATTVLAFPIPEEMVNIEGVGEVSLTKLLKMLFPKSAEVKLLSLIIDTPDDQLDKYDLTIENNRDFKDFNDVLVALKKVDPVFHAKLEPLVKENQAAYNSFTGDAKAYLSEYFGYIWANILKAVKDDSEVVVVTKTQGVALDKKYKALPAKQREDIKSKFPMLTYYITEKGYENK